MGGSRIEIVSLPRQSEEEGKMGPAINDVRIDRELGKGESAKSGTLLGFYTSHQCKTLRRGGPKSANIIYGWVGRRAERERRWRYHPRSPPPPPPIEQAPLLLSGGFH